MSCNRLHEASWYKANSESYSREMIFKSLWTYWLQLFYFCVFFFLRGEGILLSAVQWYLLHVILTMNKAQIGLRWGFYSNFLTSVHVLVWPFHKGAHLVTSQSTCWSTDLELRLQNSKRRAWYEVSKRSCVCYSASYEVFYSVCQVI